MILDFKAFNENTTYKEVLNSAIEARNALNTSDENDLSYEFVEKFSNFYKTYAMDWLKHAETVELISLFVSEKYDFKRVSGKKISAEKYHDLENKLLEEGWKVFGHSFDRSGNIVNDYELILYREKLFKKKKVRKINKDYGVFEGYKNNAHSHYLKLRKYGEEALQQQDNSSRIIDFVMLFTSVYGGFYNDFLKAEKDSLIKLIEAYLSDKYDFKTIVLENPSIDDNNDLSSFKNWKLRNKNIKIQNSFKKKGWKVILDLYTDNKAIERESIIYMREKFLKVRKLSNINKQIGLLDNE